MIQLGAILVNAGAIRFRGVEMMGWVGVATGNPRASIFAVVALFVAGGFFLSRVDTAEGRRRAAELEEG